MAAPGGIRGEALRLLASVAASLLAALILFQGRGEILIHLRRLLPGALLAVSLVGILPPLRRRLLQRPQRTGILLFLVALSISLLLPGARLEGLRGFLRILLVWPACHLLTNPGWWLRHRRGLLAAGLSCALCLALLWIVGPRLLATFVLPFYELDIDHRPKARPGFANRDGVAPDRPPEDYREEDLCIICMGDSFTYGHGVRPSDAFPRLLEGLIQAREPDRIVKVANFGWISASPVLEARQLRQIGAGYHPDLVLLAFDMTDFIDDLRYRERFRRQGWDRPTRVSIFRVLEVQLGRWLRIPEPRSWLRRELRLEPRRSVEARPSMPARRYFHMWQPLEESRPWMEPTWRTILEIHRLSVGLRASFALFILPRYVQYDRRECPQDFEAEQLPPTDEYVLEPFRFFRQKAREAPFPVHSLLPDFRSCGRFPTTQPGDPHWNETGHWVAARAIDRYLAEEGLVGPEPLDSCSAR